MGYSYMPSRCPCGKQDVESLLLHYANRVMYCWEVVNMLDTKDNILVDPIIYIVSLREGHVHYDATFWSCH